MRTRHHGTLAAIALWGACAAAAAGHHTVVSPDGATLWRLEPAGSLVAVSIPGGRAERIAGGALPPLSAITQAGELIYGLTLDPGGKTTSLLAIAPGSFEITGRRELRGTGTLVRVTPGREAACVTAGRGRNAWALHVVRLAGSGAPATISLPFEPHAMTLLADPEAPLGARLVLAGQDRLVSYTLDPPSPSWFYKSPGRHHAVAPLASAAGALVALREATLVVVDPSRRTRVDGRPVLTDDDATLVVPLAAPGRELAVSPSGEHAAVLHEGGGSLSWVDLREGRVARTLTLEGAHELAARDDVILLAGAGAAEGLVPLQRLEPPARAAAEPAAPSQPEPSARQAEAKPEPEKSEPEKSEPEKPEPAKPEPAKPEPSKPEPAKPEPSKPDSAKPEPEKPEPAKPEPSPPEPADPKPAPPAGPEAPGPSRPEPEEAELVTPRPPMPESREPEPPAPPKPPATGLNGRLTGDFASAREVRLYGPNNIVKLHARCPIGPDGSWRFPLPPAGTYRVVVIGDPGVHLFTRPEFRSVVVGGAEAALEGIDFEVRGAL